MSASANSPLSENPYVGPRTFTEKERDRFYGRDREASELLTLVSSERLVLFYAESGSGKSSLINTRVVPGLRELGFEVLPTGRVGGEIPHENSIDPAVISNIFIFNLILSINQGMPQEERQEPAKFLELSLDQFLGGDEITPASSTSDAEQYWVPPHMLIIDGFEEILTTHIDRWRDRVGFFKQLGKAMIHNPQLWVLLVMREDYLAGLDPYAYLLPSRLRSRFYMQRMGLNAALDAVKKPAEKVGRPFTDEAAERLVNNLAQLRVPGQESHVIGETVEPVQLQVVCFQLWQNIVQDGITLITEQDLKKSADVDKALRRFYEDALSAAMESQPGVSEEEMRMWFENKLVTEAGTRGTVYSGAQDGLPNPVVHVLVERFLIRSASWAGSTWYELIHDRMIGPILESNREWRRQRQDPLRIAADAWSTGGRRIRLLALGETLRNFQSQLQESPEKFSSLERDFVQASVNADERRSQLNAAQRLAILERQKYLSETGWGVIFARDSDPKVRAALQELLDLRKGQSTAKDPRYYREFSKRTDSYQLGETARAFLERHGAGLGTLAPEAMPYYLLLVGSPEEIPYSFQYQLDVNHAVGRIHFETLEEYHRYGRSVVMAERDRKLRNKTMAIFVPTYAWDPSSRHHDEQLVEKVKKVIEQAGHNRGWSLQQPYTGDQANKAALAGLMRGTTEPALIFTAGHGVHLSRRNSQQREHQGGLYCAGGQASADIRPEKDKSGYFVAEDLPKHSKLHGLIAILAASNSAGSPEYDGFSLGQGGRRKRDVDHPFVARLAQRLLSHPRGGALAIIGRIERYASTGADVYSADPDMLRAIQKLLEGYPVGAVLDPLNRRYAELAADLFEHLNTSPAVKAKIAQKTSAETRLAKIVEARSWTIVGDPAVRLAVQDIFPDMDALSEVYKAQKLIQEAEIQARQGKKKKKMESAIALFNKALDTNPALGIDPEREAQRVYSRHEYERLYEQGSKSATMGRIREAERIFAQAKKFEPDSKIEPRREAYRKAVPYYQSEGERLARKGKVRQAIKKFELAKRYGDAEIDPRTMAADLAVPYLMSEGRAAAARGHVGTAVKYFQQAASLKPDPNWDLEAEARALNRKRLAPKKRVNRRTSKK
jgi:tetratricopeptide (TPR) repeat protein